MCFLAICIMGAIVCTIIYATIRNAWIACPMCARAPSKCECPQCEHAFGPTLWSQDGWVRRCKFCGEVEYRGDDFDGGPK